jgi:hypothetical protein
MAPLNSHSRVWGLFLIFFVIAGCECQSKKENKSVAQVNAGIELTRPLQTKSVNENLPVLFLTAEEFNVIRRRVIFRFYVDSSHDLVIRGWVNRPGQNNPPAEVYPKSSYLSTVIISDSTFLGNIILDRALVDSVQARLGTGPGKFAYLKFVPDIDARPGSKGQIIYRLILTNSRPAFRPSDLVSDSLKMVMDSTLFALPPGDEDNLWFLNPSPPRRDEGFQ